MEIVSNFERAFEIGRKCLQKSRNNISRTGEYSGFDVPSLDGPWEMSEYALQNTLSYILNFLNHSCYMLCVDETGQTMGGQNSFTWSGARAIARACNAARGRGCDARRCHARRAGSSASLS